MPEPKINPLGAQQIAHPVPHPRALHDGAMGARQRRKIGGERGPLRGELRLAHHGPLAIHGLNRDRTFVQIDAGKQHTPSETKPNEQMISSLGLVGNIKPLLQTPQTLDEGAHALRHARQS